MRVSLEADLSSEEPINSEDKPTVKYVHISISYRFIFSKVQVLSSYFGFVVPVVISIYYSWVKKQWQIIDFIKKQITTIQLDNIYPRVLLNAVPVGDVLQITVNNWIIKGLIEKLSAEKAEEKIVNCEVLHDPGSEVRKADIIFVHGLKGALEKTWKQGGWGLRSLQVLNLREEKETKWEVKIQDDKSSDPKSICWPRDWLPKDCPYARVIAINYTTDPYLWRPVWMQENTRSGMSERSWEMIDSLIDLGVGKHSIFWVGHSKGGLYVKQVLVNACEAPEVKYRDLSKNTRGVIFYSVPHRGSILANLNIPLLRKSIELMEVQKDCKEVLTLHNKFKELLNSNDLAITVKSFIETRLTLMGFVYVKIVSEESADAEVGELYGIPLDHRNICKPKNRECFLYKELVKLIQMNSEV